MNYYNLKESYSICVKECPQRELRTVDDLYDYYETNDTKLCNYNIDPQDYTKQTPCGLSFTKCFGPCAALPVPVE